MAQKTHRTTAQPMSEGRSLLARKCFAHQTNTGKGMARPVPEATVVSIKMPADDSRSARPQPPGFFKGQWEPFRPPPCTSLGISRAPLSSAYTLYIVGDSASLTPVTLTVALVPLTDRLAKASSRGVGQSMGIMTVAFGTGIYAFIPVLHNTQELHSASCLQDTRLSPLPLRPAVTGWLEPKD
jgi:hypothetical protein